MVIPNTSLMEQMVYYGKVAYLLNAFLPNKTDELFFNYTKEDIVWCEENEGPIWFHFIDMELLFNSENISSIPKSCFDSTIPLLE